jgi:hypothetical protein
MSVRAPDGRLVAHISRQRLADAVGTVREVISRELKVLRTSQVIDTAGRSVTVLDEGRLASIASGRVSAPGGGQRKPERTVETARVRMEHNPPVPEPHSVESIAAGGSAVARATRNSRAVEALARAGLAARGLTYLIIALIAAQIALGGAAQSADQHGAIEDVAARPFGRLLLIAMALGFAAYALWRWSVAAVGSPDTEAESGAKEWVQRFGALAMGLVYAGLCISTILVVAGQSTSSNTQQQQSATARLLGLPLGRALVIAIGVGVAIGGGAVIWRALLRKFEQHLAMEKMGPRMKRWAIGLGIAGNGAGGIVLALAGVFLIEAAAANNAHASKGLDQTLRTVAQAPLGRVLLLLVAVGLAAYGLYSFVEMRYRRV